MSFRKNQIVYYIEFNVNTLDIVAMQIDSVETDSQNHHVYAGFTLCLYQTYLRKCEEVLFATKQDVLTHLSNQLRRLQ